MDEKGLTVADALALSRNNGDGFNGNGSGAWWVIILVLFLAFANRGNGFGGNGDGGTNTVVVPTNGGFGGGFGPCCSPATAQGMTDAFNFNALDNGIRATHDSVIDGFYQNNLATTGLGTAIQQSFAISDKSNLQSFAALQNQICNATNSVNSTLNNGFNNVQREICDTNYNMSKCCCDTKEAIMQTNFNNQVGFNGVVNALATNACDIERGQDDIKYLMAQNQSQTMVGIDRLGDRLIDFMNQKEMDNLRSELQSARFQISQQAQTEAIINQLQPVAKPSWLVSSPYQSLNYNTVNGCGCGNF